MSMTLHIFSNIAPTAAIRTMPSAVLNAPTGTDVKFDEAQIEELRRAFGARW